eukprot:m.2352 g.2352  ORF g.2352 m.2352 type:complete len:174 (+) comp3354_c0_seq1:75-596(+)
MQQSQESNRTILLKLLLCFVVYYAVAFAFAGLLVGIFDLRFQGTLPFEFDIDFKTPRSTAAWLCLVLPQVAEGFFIGIAYHHQPRQWDYIVTMALCHLILSCLGIPAPGLCMILPCSQGTFDCSLAARANSMALVCDLHCMSTSRMVSCSSNGNMLQARSCSTDRRRVSVLYQ